jgi:Tol biopolymer transport system component/tRNA A-37 threonylcarbamoyl transferase component Bud32
LIGRTLGHYEILDLVGRGGMGEVYRARDRRLGRDVAIKVVPEAIAQNPEIQSRFQREAETISGLNHPHICVLHDIGQEGDIRFLVMELVDGISLAQRLRQGPLSLAEVLRYGKEIADALDRAHRAGVIHRDLKPGNVMITKSGAKLMDFGLARVTAAEQERNDVTVAESPASPTVAHPLTAEGAIVGTFQYMAPEQLEGGEADQRSDLWALGCVLYEMATGKRAFAGKTQASLIGSILHHEPEPVSENVSVAPVELDRIVRACLAKDPDDRVQSAHDVKLQLSWIAEGVGSSASHPAPVLNATRARRLAPVTALTALVAAIVGAGATWLALETSGPPAVPRTAQLYDVGRWDLQPQSAPAFSPDGRSLVFSVREGMEASLHLRDLETFQSNAIPGTENGRSPFFSPDGRWIGFVTPSAVMKVPATGGIAQMVAELPGVSSGAWGEDDRIYLAMLDGGEDGETALMRVPAAGGTPESVGRLDAESAEGDTWLPEILPDGRTVILSLYSGRATDWQLVAFHPDGSRELLIDGAFLGRYSSRGELLYLESESQTVAAVPFEPESLTVSGGAVALTEVVDGSYCFDVSNDDKLAYVLAPDAEESGYLVWLEPGGERQIATAMATSWAEPRISPDGSRVALRKTGANCELWMLDVERSTLSRISQGLDVHNPVWSPDGQRIAFRNNSANEMFWMSVTGKRDSEAFHPGTRRGIPESWGGDGVLAFTQPGRGTLTDIWVLKTDGDSPPVPFAATAADESSPAVSPDGNWIAYVSNETGTPEVLLRKWPDDGNVWQISTGGGNSPVWSRQGDRLYYTKGQQMMSVAVRTEPAVRIEAPQVVLEGGFSTARTRDFDVDTKGRFVTVSHTGEEDGRRIRMLLDWPERLEGLTSGRR